ncbi:MULTISPECIES: MFS transporter [Amycolatopsis]|uniref:MFS transporter n=2 Tax=Amycolatopsis TaxID=1813 RepID=A0ABP9QS98_9PSEU|nr:MFS transporter [Amycolatopsis sacchari]SFJ65628.1 Predicted arabinose efflux permease, MFS family [Amycolatopsis sacchari]
MTHLHSGGTREARKVATASFLGTTIEWYDFFLYGAAAALVFGPQFFPVGNPVVSQLGSFATFAIGFLTRPLGGVIAGHFGDRLGRKRILILSLLVMGGSTVLVGLLPNYAQIGVAAPVLLVLLRLAQGLAVGAEWGGAALMAVEHAPPKRRALYGSSTQLGVPAGAILSNLMMLVLSWLTGPAFTDWGWRIGFVSSIVLVVYGLVVRRRLTESPLFTRAVRTGPARVPLLDVLRRYPAGVVTAVLATAASSAIGYTVLTFTLSYAPKADGFTRNDVLLMGILASLVQIFAMAWAGSVADRFGRRRTMVIGTVLQVAASLLLFPLLDTRVWVLALLACTFGAASNVAQYAPLPAVMSDLFPTNVRYTGSSLGYQIGGIVGGSFAPIIATGILAGSGSSFLIGVYLAGLTVVSGVAAFLAHTAPLTRRARAEDAAVVEAKAAPVAD